MVMHIVFHFFFSESMSIHGNFHGCTFTFSTLTDALIILYLSRMHFHSLNFHGCTNNIIPFTVAYNHAIDQSIIHSPSYIYQCPHVFLQFSHTSSSSPHLKQCSSYAMLLYSFNTAQHRAEVQKLRQLKIYTLLVKWL